MKKTNFKVIVHFLGWVVFFSVPVFLRMNIPLPIVEEIWVKNLTSFLLILLMFYLNYLILIPKLLFRRRFIAYFMSITGIFLLAICTNMLVYKLLNLDQAFSGLLNQINPSENLFVSLPLPIISRGGELIDVSFFKKMSIIYDFISMIPLLFVLLLGAAIRFSEQWLENERAREKIKKEKLETELSFLKNQINPHFFFNMLNNIYSLIQSAPEKAQIATHKLSKLMRYVLYEAANDKVNLSTEISFIGSYIELARIRFPELNQINFKYQISNEETLIAPLLFIPFLENIFKHGVINNPSPFIDISLNFEGEVLYFYSQNNFILDAYQTKDNGIGLLNVKRRLDLLYPDKYFLQINNDKGFFKVGLIINTR